MSRGGNFDGATAEPMIGEVTALRSFRLTDDGFLLPLTDAGGTDPWPVTISTAKCNLGRDHLSPDPDCSCGFYAYGNRAWVEDTGEYMWSRLILAAVHCSGRLVAGEKGVRAEKVRLVACYVNKHAPAAVLERLRVNYPDVEFHASRKSLLEAHPETSLSTYIEVPKRPFSASVKAALRFLPAALFPLLILGFAALFLTVGSLSMPSVFAVLLALLVGVPFIAEGVSLHALGGTPDDLRAMSRKTQVPWTRAGRPGLTLLLIRLFTQGVAMGVMLAGPAAPLTEGGWPLALSLAGVVVAMGIIGAELRRVIPIRRAFPLVPRTGAISALRDAVGEDAQGPAARKGTRVEVDAGKDCDAAMYDMGGYGIGLVHFDIVSDPADYPLAAGSASTLTKAMKKAAAAMGLQGRWIAYIASDQTRLRALTSEGLVSPPIPLAEIDVILPLPAQSWCPSAVRPSYVLARKEGRLESPLVLPLRYASRKSAPLAFSDPQIRDALEVARHLAAQGAYRDFKDEQARLPEGLVPAASPELPAGMKGGRDLEGDLARIAQALGALMGASYDASDAKALTFTMGEFLDALHATKRMNDVVTLDTSGSIPQVLPQGAEVGMRGAHLLLKGLFDLPLSGHATPSTHLSLGGRVYALADPGVGQSPRYATFTLHPFTLERGERDYGDALGNAG